MGVYTAIFATIGDTARLERTVNRYKWLLRRLEARREVWAIFPTSWHVPQLLCLMFCNITKTQLAEILDLKVWSQRVGWVAGWVGQQWTCGWGQAGWAKLRVERCNL